jgi:predicted nucleic acid-binding protein
LTAYADSSFVVSLYVPDANSARAAPVAKNQPGPILASSVVVLEATNALELRVFRGQGTRSNATRALEDFRLDIERGIFNLLPVPPSAWNAAEKLSLTHSAKIGSRSLDILQVAIALVFRADTFLTFDRNQAILARAEGLQTPIQ